MTEILEYMKLHLISLEQDLENIQSQQDNIEDLNSQEWQELDIENVSLNGQIIATRHLMSVVTDIISKTTQGE